MRIIFKWLAATLLLFICFSAKAQVVILNDNVFQGRMSEIKATVLDSLTNEPVSFASVYVIPSKDTTITNFTITDVNGQAKLDEVPYGSYVFHIEMMGYKPYVKEQYFRERKVDLGTIRLQVDEQFLAAATITDVGNPIVVKQDTVEFNASSFQVGANAMLKDLLQRMPGMEITSDGKVKFNGEAIDKLTVGGRTFFFDDQSTALNNLPASVVDKIRVIDRESEQTRASGIQDGKREKVLDVGLKKEYEKGWFGNVGLKSGTTLGDKNDSNLLRDDRGLLYNVNALASAYTEKDQVTLIANGQNVDVTNATIVVITENGERTNLNSGLSTAVQLGVNANTTRIKDVETTVSANYKYIDTDSGTKSERTTYQEDGDLRASSEDLGKQYSNTLSTDLEFKKEKGKVWFFVSPSFRYVRTNSFSSGESESFRSGTPVNRSENTTNSQSSDKSANFNASVTFREIGEKKGRSLRLLADVDYGSNSGQSAETSSLETSGGKDTRNMNYDSEGQSYSLYGSMRYTEPFGEKWSLSSVAGYTWYKLDKTRDAFDASGRNDYYSSVSRTNYVEQKYDLTAQYKFGEKSWITLGGSLTGVLNETFSKSYGIEEVTGKDEWLWTLRPTLRFQHSQGNDRFQASLYAYTQQPVSAQILPVLNISDPARLSLGNIYLKPSTQSYFYSMWNRNNKQRFSNLMAYLSASFTTNPTSYARWYDADGVLYSIPVNSRKPSLNASLTLNYSTPLDAKKNWSLDLGTAASYSVSASYQATTTLSALDKDNFDYASFMAAFWGNAAGDRFYGGLSGFGESKTRTFNPYASFSLKYNQEHYSFTLGANTQGRVSRYSLDPSINMNTLDTRLFGTGRYTTAHEYEFITELTYAFYRGYAAGYGQPEWRWNAEISKNIGAFNLSLKVHDILNQTRNLTHTVTANYEEDSYRLVMGRYILFGIKWNFGKMNASHSRKAQQAAMQMVW